MQLHYGINPWDNNYTLLQKENECCRSMKKKYLILNHKIKQQIKVLIIGTNNQQIYQKVKKNKIFINN